MNETARTVLIALGIALLVLIVVPLLVMMGMMGTMTGGMGGMMAGPGTWFMGALVLVVLLAGVALLAIGMRRRQ